MWLVVTLCIEGGSEDEDSEGDEGDEMDEMDDDDDDDEVSSSVFNLVCIAYESLQGDEDGDEDDDDDGDDGHDGVIMDMDVVSCLVPLFGWLTEGCVCRMWMTTWTTMATTIMAKKRRRTT